MISEDLVCEIRSQVLDCPVAGHFVSIYLYNLIGLSGVLVLKKIKVQDDRKCMRGSEPFCMD